jgi:hypothetical protein
MEYTQEEKQARKLWMKASEIRSSLIDTLLAHTVNPTRENLHAKLDKQLDRIDSLERKAKARFPKVRESFIIATYHLGGSKK